ncbi:MAG: restriction endonuclease [Clostridiales bacterium]|nr:restriction endonuclease [Clostridiales bacterium]
MIYSVEYDNTDPVSIEAYGKLLEGKTFLEVVKQRVLPDGELDDILRAYGNKSRKGGLGNLLEEVYFGYRANSDSEADFNEAGVELKATPYEIKKNGKKSAGERLVLSMISYEQPIEMELQDSHMWEKSRLILLVYYLRNRQLKSNLLYSINYVKLFTPPEEDLEIIKNDYRIIAEKIAAGKAHELSESDTMYLGACTKGATAEKSTVPQYYNPEVKARKRAFCYKVSYMTYVLNNYIVTDKVLYEPIVKDANVLRKTSFEKYIQGLINTHIGKTDRNLCALYGREYNNNKAQWIDLAYYMLGIKSGRAQEFEKANIVVKSIRLEENNRMKESMSFPPFRFRDLVEEEYEDSNIYAYFSETKFFFVVWKRSGNEYRLVGSQLWNMPQEDLEQTVRSGWEAVRNTISNGVCFIKRQIGNEIYVENNLPKKADNPIIHVRPHAKRSAYLFSDGSVIGNVGRDANELPNGEYMTTQSFWINNTYIMQQLDCL